MKKKSIIKLSVWSSLLLNLCICFSFASPVDEWEAFGDIAFEDGFALSPLNTKIVEEKGGWEKACVDTLYFEKQAQKPIWKIAQWNSKHDLGNTLPIRNQDGSITYTNQGKKVIWNQDGSLWLEINTSQEYDKPREENEPWPHLLIEQNFKSQPNIGKVKQLNFSMEIKLEKCERKMFDSEYNPKLHTAQTPFYFVLRNINSEAPDFNTFIWLGIPSYDYRHQQMTDKETISWDLDTSTYIYNVPQLAVWGNITFHDKQWHQAKVDVLPLIKEAIEKMKSKGFFKDTTWEDMEICGMNFGWEVPGTFDAAISVRNMSLKVIDK